MAGRSLFDPPWGLSLDSSTSCVLAAVTSGTAQVRQGEHRITLEAGEVVVGCGGTPLVMGDTHDSVIDVVVTDRDECVDPRTGVSLADAARRTGRTFGVEDGEVSVVVAAFETRGEVYALLEPQLPDLFVVPAGPSTAPLLALLEEETAHDLPGHRVATERLMEMLLIASMRTWLRVESIATPGWARGLADPVVGDALRAMHAAPEQTWTVESLAAHVAASRSGFARRFSATVGEPPLTHLTRWRMALAIDLMAAEPSLSLSEVAMRVGYADPFSFSTAFRRVRGEPPTAHRRRLLAADS